MAVKVARHLQLSGTTGTIRTAEFNGVQHTVCPVVALVEGVVWAVNAETPELVLADEFAVAPGGWNGRPVVGAHPISDGTQVSANSPEMLEKSAFGTIFNAKVEGKKLILEAWLDSSKASKVGTEAERVIERILAGESIEVSVGAYVVSENVSGKYNGKSYNAVWREIVPDHLAMLPEGSIGACSNEMGCGAPRTAVVHVLTTKKEEGMNKRSLRERLSSLLSFRSDAGSATDVSDVALRDSLSKMLRATVPGFLWVEATYPMESLVIYAASPKEDLEFSRCSYSVNETGDVTMGSDVEEVEPIMTFVPVNKKIEPTVETASSSPCGGHPTTITAPTSTTEGVKVMNEKVKALIACPNNKFTEADGVWLSQVPEAHLDALIAASVAPAKVTEPVAAAAKPMTEDEYLASAPESIRVLVARQKAIDAAKKTTLVAALKSSQTEYPEAELNTLSVEVLERLSRLAKVDADVDFSGRGLPRNDNQTDDVFSNPPDGYKLAIAARKAVA